MKKVKGFKSILSFVLTAAMLGTLFVCPVFATETAGSNYDFTISCINGYTTNAAEFEEEHGYTYSVNLKSANYYGSEKVISISSPKNSAEISGGTGAIISFPFSVTKTGNYKISIKGSQFTGNYSQYMSPWSFGINGAFTKMSADVATSTHIGINPGDYYIYRHDLNDSYALIEGVTYQAQIRYDEICSAADHARINGILHSISFSYEGDYAVSDIVIDYNTTNWSHNLTEFTEAYFTGDYASIGTNANTYVKKNNSSSAGYATIGGVFEVKTTPAFSDAAVASAFAGNTANGGTGIIISFPVTVKTAGRYSLDITASDTENKYVSEWSIGMDGVYTSSKIDNFYSTVTATDNQYVKAYDTNLTFDLTAGEHIITFRVDAPHQNKRFGAVVNNITLHYEEDGENPTPENYNVVIDYNTTDFSTNLSDFKTTYLSGDLFSNIASSTNTYIKKNTADGFDAVGGVFEMKTPAFSDEQLAAFNGVVSKGGTGMIVSFPVTVAKTGRYSLDVSASDITNNYLSDWSIGVNGVYTSAKSTDFYNTVTDIAHTYIKTYDTNLEYNFVEGEEYIISFRADELHVNKRFGCYFSNITLTYEGEPEPEKLQIMYNDTPIGGNAAEFKTTYLDTLEGTYWLNSKVNTADYPVNGAYEIKSGGQFSDTDLENFSGMPEDGGPGVWVSYEINVAQAGEYRLGVAASTIDNKYISDWSIGVDGEFTSCKEDGFIASGSNEGMDNYVTDYKTSKKYNFTAGPHTVVFRADTVHQNKRIGAAFHKISFTLVEPLDYVEYQDERIYTEIGETAAPVPTGYGISGAQIDLETAEITYTSSNTAVAEVLNNGTIRAKRLGNALITTSVTLDGVTRSDAILLCVTSDGIYIANEGYYSDSSLVTVLPSGTRTITGKIAAYNTAQEDKTAVLILAAYKDGMLLDYVVSDPITMTAGQYTYENITYANISADATMVRMYVWDSMNSIAPVANMGYLK